MEPTMTEERALAVYRNPRSTKEQLREALAYKLCEEYEKPVPKPQKKRKLVATMVQQWQVIYQEKKGVPYAFAQRDFAALKKMNTDLIALLGTDDEGLLLGGFCRLVSNPPPWYLQNAFTPYAMSRNLNAFIDHVNKKRSHDTRNIDPLGAV